MGLTRERVRQLQQRLVSRLPAGPALAPVLDQALQLVNVLLPCSAAQLGTALKDAGLARADWSGASLTELGRLMGREVALADHDGLVVAEEERQAAQAVLTAARRLSDRNGAASTEQVLQELSLKGSAPSEQLCVAVLEHHPNINWLGNGWFWTPHGSNRNRLVNTSQRILVVHQPQTLADMLEGIGRNYTWRNATGGTTRAFDLEVPPEEVVLALYRSHPAFLVTTDRDDISSAVDLDPDILGPEKLTMVGILRDQPYSSMTRNELIAACTAAGMQTSTTGVFITYAECIKNFGHNVWGLRGTAVPRDVVEAMQSQARSTARAFNAGTLQGATKAGHLWFAQRLSQGVVFAGVLSGSMSRLLPGDRQLTITDAVDGESVGTMKRSGEHFLYGLSALLRKHRVQPGTVIRAVLHLDDGFVNVEFGDEELLEEPEDW